jgi:hypothetical protein
MEPKVKPISVTYPAHSALIAVLDQTLLLVYIQSGANLLNIELTYDNFQKC